MDGAACLAVVSFQSTMSNSPVLLVKLLKNLDAMAQQNQTPNYIKGGIISTLGAVPN